MNKPATDVFVLCVEDDKTDQMLFRRIWKKLIPNEPLMADSGTAALELLDQALQSGSTLPDLIFLDLNMPKKDGHETLKRIKSDPELMHIPVIVLSTSQQQRDIDLCYQLHANAYMCKQIDHKAMVAAHRRAYEFWCQLFLGL